ncbi:hypothetical protein SFUMM280S_05148 [Streptomyces fumanus]
MRRSCADNARPEAVAVRAVPGGGAPMARSSVRACSCQGAAPSRPNVS